MASGFSRTCVALAHLSRARSREASAHEYGATVCGAGDSVFVGAGCSRRWQPRAGDSTYTDPVPPRFASIDDYLDTIDPVKRAALEKIRRAIKAAAPRAEECFGYGVPAFRLDGTLIAGFHAAKQHCSYFPMSGKVVTLLKKELAAYDAVNGTIRFAPAKPLPAALVRKLVRARLAEG